MGSERCGSLSCQIVHREVTLFFKLSTCIPWRGDWWPWIWLKWSQFWCLIKLDNYAFACVVFCSRINSCGIRHIGILIHSSACLDKDLIIYNEIFALSLFISIMRCCCCCYFSYFVCLQLSHMRLKITFSLSRHIKIYGCILYVCVVHL